MKFIKEDLKRAVSALSMMKTDRADTVFIIAENGTANLIKYGGNGIFAVAQIPCLHEGKEHATIPSGRVSKLLNFITSEAVTVIGAEESTRVGIYSFENVAHISALPDHQWNVPIAEGSWFSMPKEMLTSVSIASRYCSKDVYRYGLNNIALWQYEGDMTAGLKVVATNGHRIFASRSYAIQSGLAANSNVTFSHHYARMFDKADSARFSISTGVNGLSKVSFEFMFGMARIVVNDSCNENQFPDWVQIIPHGQSRKCANIDDSIRRRLEAIAISNSERKSVQFCLIDDKIPVLWSGDTIDDPYGALEGMSSKEIDEASIGVSMEYVLDTIKDMKKIGSGHVIISFGGQLFPVVMTRSGEPEELIIIMPMRFRHY